jgi:D-arabinose 5-phosphate isomerase GutQ
MFGSVPIGYCRFRPRIVKYSWVSITPARPPSCMLVAPCSLRLFGGKMKERFLQNGQRLDETLQQSHGRTARQSLNAGASALAWLAEERAEDVFRTGLALSSAQGRILTSGVGKAGIVARGIAELFAASGSPAYFLHPTEAMHGDLGIICPGDEALVISWSGETLEVVRLLPHLKRRGARITALTGYADSSLGRAADMTLSAELLVADHAGKPPTTSTVALLALGHALVLTVLENKSLPANIVADLHPATWRTLHEH